MFFFVFFLFFFFFFQAEDGIRDTSVTGVQTCALPILSPGAALVFLLAGPATNIATLGVVGKDLGLRALVGYLAGIAISAVAFGLALDAGLAAWNVDIQVQMAASTETIPEALKQASGLLLAPFFALSLYKEARKRLRR